MIRYPAAAQFNLGGRGVLDKFSAWNRIDPFLEAQLDRYDTVFRVSGWLETTDILCGWNMPSWLLRLEKSESHARGLRGFLEKIADDPVAPFAAFLAGC